MSRSPSLPDRFPEVERVVTVLAVHPSAEDQHSLREIFQHSNWNVQFARDRREAVVALKGQRQAIVICEALLPDGDWKDILRETAAMPAAPPIIVTSTHADDWLWAEVLNLGGYDVLAKPFDLKEVVRVTSLAWLHWRGRAAPAKPCTPTKALAAEAAS
jgi:DNA-binding response OmpR family regulator